MHVHFKNFGAVTAVRCGYYEGTYNYPSHIHQFPEIVFCEKGELEIITENGRELLREGDIAVIAPFQAHEFVTPKYTKRWLAVFSPDFLSNFITEENLYKSMERCVFSASDSLLAYIKPRLLASNERFFELNEQDVRSFKAFFIAVYEEYLRKVPESSKRRHTQALPAILQYIFEHYKEKLSLSSIGHALGYSPKYVSLCLSNIRGLNLFQLINSFRAEHAKFLLLSTDMKIIDIAYECGYDNEKSFYRAFSQVTGMTPGQYKKTKRTFKVPETEDMYYFLYKFT